MIIGMSYWTHFENTGDENSNFDRPVFIKVDWRVNEGEIFLFLLEIVLKFRFLY